MISDMTYPYTYPYVPLAKKWTGVRKGTYFDKKGYVKGYVQKVVKSLIYSIISIYMYIYVPLIYTPIIYIYFSFTYLLGYRAFLYTYTRVKGVGVRVLGVRRSFFDMENIDSQSIKCFLGRTPSNFSLTVYPKTNGSSQKSRPVWSQGVYLVCN